MSGLRQSGASAASGWESHQEQLPEVPEYSTNGVPDHGRPPSNRKSRNFRDIASRAATASRTLVSRLKSPRAPRVKVLKDSEELKIQLYRTIHEGKTVYNVESFYKEHGVMQRIARSTFFQNMTLFMILSYALWLSYDTDVNDAPTLLEAKAVLEALAILVALRRWSEKLKGMAIQLVVQSDSITGRTATPRLAVDSLVGAELAICLELAIEEVRSHHIPGKANIEADFLSRPSTWKTATMPGSLSGVDIQPEHCP
eukprot:s241_g4.t1